MKHGAMKQKRGMCPPADCGSFMHRQGGMSKRAVTHHVARVFHLHFLLGLIFPCAILLPSTRGKDVGLPSPPLALPSYAAPRLFPDSFLVFASKIFESFDLEHDKHIN